ncbi:MAG TPA: rRNA maturation RNase YbeY [Bryobacteraceae bacterium]|jgi:probable rRNA maturation factor
MSPGSTLLFGAIPTQLKFPALEKRQLAGFARSLSNEVAAGRPFTCLIADDRELRRLNFAFLANNYPTDVLSFPSPRHIEDLGEIAISVERAEAQAHEFGHGRLDEICLLMLHGVLHLVGLDHETDDGRMARAERLWRAHFGLPQNLIARSETVLTP